MLRRAPRSGMEPGASARAPCVSGLGRPCDFCSTARSTRSGGGTGSSCRSRGRSGPKARSRPAFRSARPAWYCAVKNLIHHGDHPFLVFDLIKARAGSVDRCRCGGRSACSTSASRRSASRQRRHDKRRSSCVHWPLPPATAGPFSMNSTGAQAISHACLLSFGRRRCGGLGRGSQLVLAGG